MRELADALLSLRLDEAREQMRALIDDDFAAFTSEAASGFFDGLTQGAARLIDDLDIARSSAQGLSDALRAVQEADGPEAQADALRKVDQIMQAIRREQDGLTGAQAEFLGEILDTEDGLRAALALVNDMDRDTRAAASSAAGLADAWAGVADAVAGAQAAVARAQIRLQTVGQPIDRAGQLAGYDFDVRNNLASLGGDLSTLPSAYRQRIEAARRSVVDDAREAARLEGVTFGLEHPARGASSRSGGGGGRGSRAEAAAAARKERDAYADVIDALQREREAIGQTELVRRQAQEIRDAEVSSTSEQADNIRVLVAELYEAEQAQDAFHERSEFLSGALKDLWSGAISGAEDFQDALANVSARLGDLLLDKAFSGFADALIGGFTGALGGSVGKPLAGTNFLAGAYAGGTDFAAGGLSLVGERGPEIVSLPRGARVVPNHRLASESGRGGVVLHFTSNVDARGADRAAVDRIERGQAKMAAEFEAKVIKTIRDASAGRNL